MQTAHGSLPCAGKWSKIAKTDKDERHNPAKVPRAGAKVKNVRPSGYLAFLPQHFLYLSPLPQGQGSLGPIFFFLF